MLQLINDILSELKNIDPKEKEKLNEALQLSIDLHSGQKARPDGPYIHHIFRVARRIANYFEIKDVDIIIAALLHDAIEDQSEKLHEMAGGAGDAHETALQHIADKFGKKVASIVEAVTNPVHFDSLDTDERNRQYAAHIAEIINDRDVFYVKLSDFSDNGLNLNDLRDKQKRLALAKKYAPLYTIFLHRLRQPDIEINEHIKGEISGKLLDARIFAQMVIAAQ
jgi:(p)ppGpp synthase/HD superfamily hydrolase